MTQTLHLRMVGLAPTLSRWSVISTRLLGTTGMRISRVGFGAWTAGRIGWGSQDDSDSVAAILRAVDLGVNWIDTAPSYGFGHSEEVIARALAKLPERDRPLIFTKCGIIWDKSQPTPLPTPVATFRSIRQELAASLKRLRRDHIDLYQVHRPPESDTPVAEYWGTMLELKREGKVRAVGLSNHGVKAAAQAEQVGHVDSMQPPLSLVSRSALADLIPWCADHQIGVVVYSPMKSGLLSGAFTLERAASLRPNGDWRGERADFEGDQLRRSLSLVDGLRPLAAARGVTVGALAIAWTLSLPGVTAAIVGARTPVQVDGWAPAANIQLSRGESDSVSALLAATGAGS